MSVFNGVVFGAEGGCFKRIPVPNAGCVAYWPLPDLTGFEIRLK
jgi:hypothetical protein